MPRAKGTGSPRPAGSKLVPRARLRALGAGLRGRGLKVVFTNGVFDLLHAGHVALLEAARSRGDILVVGVNGDDSARSLAKGPGRPIVGERDRAILLAALEAVDHVTIFPEPTPLETIRALLPDVLVKGSDWRSGTIVGSDVVRARGGRVVRVRLKGGRSTTGIVRRILRAGPAGGDVPGPRRRR